MTPPLVLLVVDDHRDNRSILRTILEHAGHRVLTAVDGEEAIDSARHAAPDLILMDIMMPRLDGRAATRQLKADPATKRIPVLAVSAHLGALDDASLREDGFCGFLAKPVLPSTVLEAVHTCLAQTGKGATWVDLAISP